jgi:heme exporter protein D
VFLLLLVLFLLVALAVASFFQHMLAAFLILLALPVFALLHALIGTFYAAFAMASLAILIALIQTITSSLWLLRQANAAPARRARQAELRRSNRSRIAA